MFLNASILQMGRSLYKLGTIVIIWIFQSGQLGYKEMK